MPVSVLSCRRASSELKRKTAADARADAKARELADDGGWLAFQARCACDCYTKMRLVVTCLHMVKGRRFTYPFDMFASV